ncbi:MAG: hypothetical protein LUC24_01345 [Bacteroidales bacterium]|nr:hypothetical protein [Bacteroidales bacterium]
MGDKFRKIMVEAVFAVLIIAAEIALLAFSHSNFVKICAGLVIVLEIIRIVAIILQWRNKHDKQ